MNQLQKKLKTHGPIHLGIVGCGLMGGFLVNQVLQHPGYELDMVSSRRLESILQALERAGIKENDFQVCQSLEDVRQARSQGKLAITTDNSLVARAGLDCLVDATGNTVAGAEITVDALNHKTHVVSLNVEMDVLIGPYLHRLAQEEGVLYTGTYGDEPGSIQELYEFCQFVGLKVIALGKGKNNPLNRHVRQEDLAEEAHQKGLSPRMLTSFVDGTNTMIELNCVCNSTGLVPSKPGCHGLKADSETLPDFFGPGRLIEKTGVVDFVHGLAPGVFALVEAQDGSMDEELQFLKMGKGPYYTIYRPYHLTSIETPISIAKAVLEGETSIYSKEIKAQTVAVAKRDLSPGEGLNGIGSNEVYGLLLGEEDYQGRDYVPIGLLTDKCYLKKALKKDQALRFADVEMEETLLYQIYRTMWNSFDKEGKIH